MHKVFSTSKSLNLLYLVVLLQACNRDVAFDCAKRTGEIITLKTEVPAFQYIILKDNIDLILRNGLDSTVTIEAGKNLMPEIYLQSQGDTLIISNNNTCNWVRNFKHRITVTLTVPEILTLVHRGYGEIKSADTLKVHEIYLYSLDAGGNFDLQVQSEAMEVYSNSHSFIQLAGQANNLYIWMHKGIGRIFTEKLVSKYCKVKHEGSNEIRIFPLNESYVEIYANGNVLYYNEPAQLTSIIKGSGKLIKR